MTDLNEIRGFFDRLAPTWDQSCHHDERVLSAILTLAACPSGGRILDVACGTGVLLPYLLKLEPEALHAIDLSPEMADRAAAKYTDPRVTVRAADFYEYGAEPFDLITVYSAYPHFFDKDAFAARAFALLRPGGRLLIAHSQSRMAINARHGGGAAAVSVELRSTGEESRPLAPFFHLDAAVDTDVLYLLSGTRREAVPV